MGDLVAECKKREGDLIKGRRSEPPPRSQSRSVTPRRSEPSLRDDRRNATPRRSDPPQRGRSSVKDAERVDATGKVALAGKLANRNGGELSADVVQSYAELSADAAAGRPGVARTFRKHVNAVLAANRFGGGGRRDTAVAEKFTDKATLSKYGGESEEEGASSARDFTEPEAE